MERWITLIFLQNICTVIRGVHRHQANVLFSLHITRTYRATFHRSQWNDAMFQSFHAFARTRIWRDSKWSRVYSHAQSSSVFLRSYSNSKISGTSGKIISLKWKGMYIGMADHENGRKEGIAYPIPTSLVLRIATSDSLWDEPSRLSQW